MLRETMRSRLSDCLCVCVRLCCIEMCAYVRVCVTETALRLTPGGLGWQTHIAHEHAQTIATSAYLSST